MDSIIFFLFICSHHYWSIGQCQCSNDYILCCYCLYLESTTITSQFVRFIFPIALSFQFIVFIYLNRFAIIFDGRKHSSRNTLLLLLLFIYYWPLIVLVIIKPFPISDLYRRNGQYMNWNELQIASHISLSISWF